MNYNALKDIADWLVSHGAPMATLSTDLVTYPGGSYQWNRMTFERGDAKVDMMADLVATSPSVALCDLQHAHLADGDPNVRVDYVPPAPPAPPPPPPPTPIDTVIGIPDPVHVGLFQGATYWDYMAGRGYTSACGRKFKAVMVGTPPMALFFWSEVAA